MANKIIIDGNSIGYAAHSVRELIKDGNQVQAIFFSLKMIKNTIDKFGSEYDQVQVLWDTRAQWRYDIYPGYKGKRDKDPVKAASRKAYKEQIKHIRKGLHLLGIEQIVSPNEEADDLGAALVHSKAPEDKILLVTGDRDWLQLISDTVKVYDPRGEGILFTAENFTEKTGFENVVLFSQAKAILGDTSDSVTGVDGIGEKSLALIFENWGSIPRFIQYANGNAVDTGAGKELERAAIPKELQRFTKKLNSFAFGEGLEVFKRNMQLMNLLSKRHRSDEITGKSVHTVSSFDKEGFNVFCNIFGFLSIYRAIDAWALTFAKFESKKSGAQA